MLLCSLYGVLLDRISYCIVHIASLVIEGRSGFSFARPVVLTLGRVALVKIEGGGPLESWGDWGPCGLRFKLAG